MSAVTDARPPASSRRSTALKREVGLIGLLWASMGSIIGSGWLFGAQKGLMAAGPAAIISWVIGGFAILVLALIHAELGGMYPVSGGTARFPHYAFGGAAGASFGWFSWLQAATVAPIEVSAMITYGQHYSFAQGWLDPKTGVLTTSGIVVAVVLMGLMTAINFLGVRKLAATNSAATWWKVAIPLLTIFVLAFANFQPSNLHAANGFNPDGLKGILAAVSTGGIIFSYLGFEQADQLAGESKNPRRDVPFAIIGSIVLGMIIYIALQVAFLFALPPSAIGKTWTDASSTAYYTVFTGPFAELATAAQHRLAGLAPVRRRDHLAGRHRAHLHHGQLAGLVRTVAQRLRADALRVDQLTRSAVVGADRGVRDRVHLLPAVPELAVAGRPDHQRLGADVRRCAALARCVPAPAAATPSGRTGCRRPS